ncbi:hypothetical protein KC19_10G046500 [Ceratodon purpureus]|uniref:Uncharacterized protein n=1 Tax=Ceratodon purpureus TaxID=3225 RepID=A0A8T0GJC4_CERPU|nr:hypothetical protein KC19_10G046500 [Ceratodon purpureus]
MIPHSRSLPTPPVRTHGSHAPKSSHHSQSSDQDHTQPISQAPDHLVSPRRTKSSRIIRSHSGSVSPQAKVVLSPGSFSNLDLVQIWLNSLGRNACLKSSCELL